MNTSPWLIRCDSPPCTSWPPNLSAPATFVDEKIIEQVTIGVDPSSGGDEVLCYARPTTPAAGLRAAKKPGQRHARQHRLNSGPEREPEQQRSPAARGTNKPVWPASCIKKRSAARLVKKFFLELRQRASAPHRSALRIGAASSAPRFDTTYSGT